MKRDPNENQREETGYMNSCNIGTDVTNTTRGQFCFVLFKEGCNNGWRRETDNSKRKKRMTDK